MPVHPIERRPYQPAAVEAIFEAWKRVRRVLFVLPPGGGKTHVAVTVIRRLLRKGLRGLFFAHRHELLKQCFAKLVRAGLDPARIGIIKAGVGMEPADSTARVDIGALSDDDIWARFARERLDAPFHIASIQTFTSRNHAGKVDFLIIDEAHRALAKSYRDVLDAYTVLTLGLTATPERTDRKPLRGAFDEMVEGPTVKQLVAMVFLAIPQILSVDVGLLAEIRKVPVTRGGDYAQEALVEAMDRNRSIIVGNVVKHYLRYVGDRTALLVAVNVEQAKRYRDAFHKAGVAVAHIDGATKPEERDEILAKLGRGEIRLVTSCIVLIEGWDMPRVKLLINLHPTKSRVIWTQMVGRVMRPWNDVRPIVLDHTGTVHDLGRPQDDQPWSLDVPPKREGNGGAICKACPECNAAVPAGQKMCECGYGFPPTDPVEMDGNLVEVTEAMAWPRPCPGIGNEKKCPRDGTYSSYSRTKTCHSCASRAACAKMTPEQRSVRSRKAQAGLTPEQRSARDQRFAMSMTAEQRSANARKATAAMTPEQLQARGRKVNASVTFEQRSANGRKSMASMTFEQRSAAGRKLQASRTPEQRLAAALKAQAALTPEQRSANSRKGNAARKAAAS